MAGQWAYPGLGGHDLGNYRRDLRWTQIHGWTGTPVDAEQTCSRLQYQANQVESKAVISWLNRQKPQDSQLAVGSWSLH